MNADYTIFRKSFADNVIWWVVGVKTWRGIQFVSKHKTKTEANNAVKDYKKNPPIIGNVIKKIGGVINETGK